ncbi:proton-conducting transporter membrane subunit [Streptosporangium sp. NPDC006007]|uniref:proton-conducting transporter transmembrane domain-containing protein n=1 Tax=Streptosporangium sp. NPDC006007 TaxID=3154575 RepID=UPI0033A2FDAB
MIQSIDYYAVAPLLLLVLTAGLVLLLDAFLPRRPYVRPLLGAVTLAGVLGALGVVLSQALRLQGPMRTFCVPGGLRSPATTGLGTLGLPPGAVPAPPLGVTPGPTSMIFSGPPPGVTPGPVSAIALGSVSEVASGPTSTIVPGPFSVLFSGLPPEVARSGAAPLFGSESGAAPGSGPGGGDAVLCSFVVDHFTLVFAGLALAAGVIVVLLSMAELSLGEIPVGEWYFLLLCTLAGAVALPASRDLVMLVVALELVSLPVFALTALKRYDGRSSEAAVKLFLVSVVSTAVMLFGVSLLYGATGTVYLDRLARSLSWHIAGSTGGPGSVTPVSSGAGASLGAHAPPLQIPPDLSPVLTVAIVLVLAGFAFKVAAVPFHAWAGDVYQGAPVPVAALLSVISKAAGFAGLILILVLALRSRADTWVPLIAIIAALTMTVGNLLALRQRHAVRLLAWSSVAQSGYILAPLGVHDDETMSASIAYLVFYAAMNLGAFAVVMLVSRRRPRNELDDYRGLAFRSPAAGLALAFFLICLAGLPPGLAGMFAKIVVFRELVDGGGVWPAAVMAVNTVIGLYYYVVWTTRILTPGPSSGTSSAPGPTPSPTPVSTSAPAPSPALVSAGVSAGVSVESGAAVIPETDGDRTGWVPVAVAITLAVVIAVVFSVAPQTVLGPLPTTFVAPG